MDEVAQPMPKSQKLSSHSLNHEFGPRVPSIIPSPILTTAKVSEESWLHDSLPCLKPETFINKLHDYQP